MPSPAQSTKALLVQRASAGASLAQSIDAALATWLALDAALSPIIGPSGFAALYRRSLQVTRAQFPWLAPAQSSTAEAPEFSALRTILAQQSEAAAAAASAALLEAFYDLLTKLIGPSLSDRLLSAVCESPPSGQAAQDTSP